MPKRRSQLASPVYMNVYIGQDERASPFPNSLTNVLRYPKKIPSIIDRTSSCDSLQGALSCKLIALPGEACIKMATVTDTAFQLNQHIDLIKFPPFYELALLSSLFFTPLSMGCGCAGCVVVRLKMPSICATA